MGINVPGRCSEPDSSLDRDDTMPVDQPEAEGAITNTDYEFLGTLGTREKALVCKRLSDVRCLATVDPF